MNLYKKSFLLGENRVKELKIAHEFLRDVLGQEPAGLGPHEQGHVEVPVLAEVDEVLVVVVGDGVDRLALVDLLEVALALRHRADQHGRGLDQLLQFLLRLLVAGVEDVDALVVGDHDGEEVPDLAEVLVDVLGHGAFVHSALADF